MKKIGILSDTHGYFDDTLREFFRNVDELWHCGDFGSIETADNIAAFKPLVGVRGNVDGGPTRIVYPEFQFFEREGATILMTHIGGYPGRYFPDAERMINRCHPQIFVCGHSHILKVIYDKKYNLLHINPGAAGISGFHNVRTAIRLILDNAEIKELEVGEWPKSNNL